MAVYAAHLTRTLSGAPSIFEVTAQEQLSSTVQPALRKLVEFIATLSPGKFFWLVRWYDELYLIFNGVLQYHYLKHYAASFAECFYGLRRVALESSEFTDGLHLPAAAERASLLLLAVAPYLRGKLDELAARWRLDHADGLLGKSWTDACKKHFPYVHAAAHCAYESLRLAHTLAYLAGRARSPSPALRLAGVTLAYAPDVPIDEFTWRQLWASLAAGDFGSAAVSFNMVGTAVLRGMEVGAFFIQFLKWWESRAGGAASALPVPPPPQLEEKSARVMNRCPVCLQQWRIPTALPVSGFIFCYRCITRQLRDAGVCPVTRYPAREQDLVRMYLDT